MTPEPPPPSAPSAVTEISSKQKHDGHEAPAFRPRFRAIYSLLLVVACVTTAEVLLKMGAYQTREAGAGNSISFGFGALGSWYTIVGIVFHVAAFGAWIYTLKSVPLSLAFNFTTVQQVTVPIAAWLLIPDETMPLLRVVGIAIVIAGALLLVPAIVTAERTTEGRA
jgi:drug/metabolite transporter (DMT)-like permease